MEWSEEPRSKMFNLASKLSECTAEEISISALYENTAQSSEAKVWGYVQMKHVRNVVDASRRDEYLY